MCILKIFLFPAVSGYLSQIVLRNAGLTWAVVHVAFEQEE